MLDSREVQAPSPNCDSKWRSCMVVAAQTDRAGKAAVEIEGGMDRCVTLRKWVCWVTLNLVVKTYVIEVRDSRTGYLVPGHDGLGARPNGRVLGKPPPPSPPPPSLGKWPNIRKCTLFPKLACPKIPEMLIFQKWKPLREFPNTGKLLKITIPPTNKLIFTMISKSDFVSHNLILW